MSGPSLSFLGFYKIEPDAIISLKFVGKVALPPGTWTVGNVQNLVFSNHIVRWSEGGRVAIAAGGTEKFLDVLNTATDIFLDTLGTGVVTLSSPDSHGRFTFDISLESGDVPRKLGPGWEGLRKDRCNKTITETLVDIDVTNVFAAALVARKDGVVHQLVVTDDKYGYRYRLEIPSGGGNVDRSDLEFHPFQTTKLLRPVPPEARLAITGETANTVTNRRAVEAEQRYLADCTKKPTNSGTPL